MSEKLTPASEPTTAEGKALTAEELDDLREHFVNGSGAYTDSALVGRLVREIDRLQAARAEAAATMRHDFAALRATAADQVLTAINAEDDSVPFYEGQVYAYDEVLRRLLAAPPTEPVE